METNTIKCVECGGEMKEVNANIMKCKDCGKTMNKNKGDEKETEDMTKI